MLTHVKAVHVEGDILVTSSKSWEVMGSMSDRLIANK